MKNVDIIKGCPEVLEAGEEEEAALYKAFLNIQEKKRDEYDYMIIDTRPSFGGLTEASIYAADILLTPVCLDNFCRDNLTLVDTYLDSIPERVRPVWKVFTNKVIPNRKVQRVIFEDLYSKHDYPIMESCIRSSETVNTALQLYKPIQKHKDSHYSFTVEKDGKYYICAKDYKSTATEFVNALILGCGYGNLGHDKNATVVYDDSAWVASKNNILTLWQLSHADCNIIITADSLSEILKIKPSELSEKDSLSKILKVRPSELSEKMIKDICTYWDIIHL